MKQTFAFIKPCAQSRGDAAKMKRDIESAGFKIIKEAETVMTREQAEWLYREHSKKAHFRDLVDFTISGPITMMILEGKDDMTPSKFRILMGPSNIEEAAPDTLRGRYAETVRRNGIHGSDGNESAELELTYFASHFER